MFQIVSYKTKFCIRIAYLIIFTFQNQNIYICVNIRSYVDVMYVTLVAILNVFTDEIFHTDLYVRVRYE